MPYLDNNNETKPCQSALERMKLYLEQSATPSELESKYQILSSFISAKKSDRFVFTSSGAEGINQVFWSIYLEKARKEGKSHVIVSCLEDAPTMQCAKRLEELGCTIKIVPVNAMGQIDLAQLAELINPRVALISVTMAHGLTGVIQPFDEITQIARAKNVLVHLDATHAIGKIPFEWDSDYLTFSGDRIHSVKNSGALFAKEKVPLVPLILGGSGLKAGFDVPSFMALSAAAQQAALYLDLMSLEIPRLRDLFESKIEGTVLYKESLRLPNTSAIAFEGVHAEAVLYYLNRKGVCATIGGAYCQHLSRLTGSENAVSFALSRMTTEEEVVQAADIVNGVVRDLQDIGKEAIR